MTDPEPASIRQKTNWLFRHRSEASFAWWKLLVQEVPELVCKLPAGMLDACLAALLDQPGGSFELLIHVLGAGATAWVGGEAGMWELTGYRGKGLSLSSARFVCEMIRGAPPREHHPRASKLFGLLADRGAPAAALADKIIELLRGGGSLGTAGDWANWTPQVMEANWMRPVMEAASTRHLRHLVARIHTERRVPEWFPRCPGLSVAVHAEGILRWRGLRAVWVGAVLRASLSR